MCLRSTYVKEKIQIDQTAKSATISTVFWVAHLPIY